MDRVLILDTETTGLDPAKDHVIEIGVILYSIKHGCSLVSFSSILGADSNPAEAINHIPAAALADQENAMDVWGRVEMLAATADAVLAHNAAFDRDFVTEPLRQKKWICTKNDVAWPKQTRVGASLVSLVLEHGLGVASAHRALTDCDMIARLLTRARELGVDVAEMLRHAMRPKATFMALVPFDRKEEAKKAGFQWDGEGRRWLRTMFIDDTANLSFQTRQVQA